MKRTLATACFTLFVAASLVPGPGARLRRGQGAGAADAKPPCCQAAAGQPAGCCGMCGLQAQQATNAKTTDPQAAPAPAAEASPAQMGMMTSAEHDNIFNLLSSHASITRKVEEVPGGVKTTTTTSDPALVNRLRLHVREMNEHLEQNRPVRLWDPAFQDIFAHASDITLTWKDVDNGIEVTETSDNPAAVKAIRTHAAKVDSFVAKGHEAARPPWAGGGRGMGPGQGMGPGRGRMMGRGAPNAGGN